MACYALQEPPHLREVGSYVVGCTVGNDSSPKLPSSVASSSGEVLSIRLNGGTTC
jgi:hypothetical protein